ncbi:hypothetical protein NDU88_011873 [Pleurodeles waltl]|uniref:Uncharacterized protein n=1 Tax=Pleurodeles waltl TaxID=8319 RepID=A0AAV7S665_PLEWA|nr:hypothetical protein NDU88_011873 [Pleurodeles waltl]
MSSTLETIFQSIMAHREETRAEGHQLQVAIRKLQGVVCKVAKACNTIIKRVNDLETRTAALDVNAAGAMGQLKAQESQLVNIQWKLEDQENRQRRNNLQVLGVLHGGPVSLRILRSGRVELGSRGSKGTWHTNSTEAASQG